MNKKTTSPAAKKPDKAAKIVLVRNFGEQDLIQLYSKYIADKIMAAVSEEKNSA